MHGVDKADARNRITDTSHVSVSAADTDTLALLGDGRPLTVGDVQLFLNANALTSALHTSRDSRNQSLRLMGTSFDDAWRSTLANLLQARGELFDVVQRLARGHHGLDSLVFTAFLHRHKVALHQTNRFRMNGRRHARRGQRQ